MSSTTQIHVTPYRTVDVTRDGLVPLGPVLGPGGVEFLREALREPKAGWTEVEKGRRYRRTVEGAEVELALVADVAVVRIEQRLRVEMGATAVVDSVVLSAVTRVVNGSVAGGLVLQLQPTLKEFASHQMDVEVESGLDWPALDNMTWRVRVEAR